MRVLALILMTLAFIVGGTCSGILFKNLENRMGGSDYSVVDEMQAQVDEAKASGVDLRTINDPELQEMLDVLDNIPPQWQVATSGPLGIALSVSALVMVIVAFMKKPAIKLISAIVVVMAITLWAITPNIEAGLFTGVNPKSITLISLIALTISAAFAFLSFTLIKKKAV